MYSRSAAESAAEQAASSSRTRTALVILLLLMMWHLEKGFKEDYLRFPRKIIFFEFGLFLGITKGLGKGKGCEVKDRWF